MHPPLASTLAAGWRGLSLYVLGPGVGECQVLLLPDGKVVVVDACMADGRNLGVDLLQALGVTKVDLFVVTHPDQDHVRGAAGLLDTFKPNLVWIYPTMSSLRDLLVRAKREASAEGLSVSAALADLTDFAESLRRHQSAGLRVQAIRSTSQVWRFAGSGYEVKPIAPTDEDELEAARRIESLNARPQRRSDRFVAWVEDFLAGKKRPADHPNQLSIALSVSIEERRILLGGDVECGNGRAGSGWSGIMQCLGQSWCNQSHLLRCADVVKVAHHGSQGAFHAPAWAEHTARRTPTIGVIAPYSRQVEQLPRSDGLARLREVLPSLAITATTYETRRAAIAAGWKAVTPTKQPEPFPMVALRVPLAGPTEVSVWGDASVWSP